MLLKDHNTTNLPGGENKLFTKPKQKVSCETVQEPAAVRDKSDQRVDCSREWDNEKAQTRVMQQDSFITGTTGGVALRTIPEYLKNGNKKLRVNTLLDDASTMTYLNTDVAAELGLQGQVQKINVSVLNGLVESFETLPVECVI